MSGFIVQRLKSDDHDSSGLKNGLYPTDNGVRSEASNFVDGKNTAPDSAAQEASLGMGVNRAEETPETMTEEYLVLN